MEKAKLISLLDVSAMQFLKKGYKQTQVSDIAKDASIATGSIYNYFEGKRALFDCTICYLFDLNWSYDEITFPFKEISHEDIWQDYIKKSFEFYYSRLYDIYNCENPFIEFIDAIFSMLNTHWRGILILERDTISWPLLSKEYSEGRSEFIGYTEKAFIELMKKGYVNEIDESQVSWHVRFIIESISWWGMHRKYMNEEQFDNDDKAKDIVIEVITRAYSA